jgi:DNA repair exonuclease SbcCD nuclease subunit
MSPRVVCSDCHLDKAVIAGYEHQYRVEKALAAVIKYAGDGPVFIAGDLLNKKNMQTDVIVRFNKFIQKYRRKPGEPIFIISGNHELTPDNNSVLDLVDWPSNVVLVSSKPFLYVDKRLGDIFLVPYLHSDYAETISDLPQGSIVVSHVLVDGASGRIRLSSDTKPDLFKKFRLVILGDVHKYQHFDNIYYCGNLVQSSHADVGNSQGFLVLDDKANISRKRLKLPELQPLEHDEDQTKAERLETILNAELPVTASLNSTEAMDVVKGFVFKTYGKTVHSKQYLQAFTR